MPSTLVTIVGPVSLDKAVISSDTASLNIATMFLRASRSLPAKKETNDLNRALTEERAANSQK